MIDRYDRTIDYLRISVTDRCDLRCLYCMPADGVEPMAHAEVLRYEEILRLARIFAKLGLKKVRLTGGEPLVRRDLDRLVAGLKAIDGIERVSLTTNGMLLTEQLKALVAAGLDGVNISIDALDEGLFQKITRREGADRVRRAIDASLGCGRLNVKLNCVPMGLNDSQLVPIALLAKTSPLCVRFIELMPIGPAAGLSCRTEAEVRAILAPALGELTPDGENRGDGPCRYYRAAGLEGRIGFISAMSHKFCDNCNRVRLTAGGFLKTCLQYDRGVELKTLLPLGDDALQSAIENAIFNKPACHHFSEGGGDGRGMYQIGG